MDNNKDLFENMPVPKALASLAVPTIISQLITMVYNLGDTFFIGQTNDPYKVAGATMCYVLFFIMTSLANLFGVGGGSLISRLLGEKRPDDAQNVSSFSFYGAIVVSLLYALVCQIFMTPLLNLLGASENTMVYCRQYTRYVVVWGALPSTMSMTIAHLLRSVGHAKEASFGLGMGGILNLILDPLFMFVLFPAGNEVTGAAVATLLSNIISLLYYAIIFSRLQKTTVLSAAFGRLAAGVRFVGPVFAVGLPSALSSLLSCFANILINRLASGYGDIPVAAVGIVKKIDMLPMNVNMGLCQGMVPLVAYNYAAKNYSRMHAVTKYARAAGMGFALLCIAVYEAFAPGIIRLFIREPQTLALGTQFLRICCLATPLMACNFMMSYIFQAMGKGRESLLLASCRQGLINIPLMFVMNALFGLYGIVWTQLLSDSLTLIISFLLYRRTYGKLLHEQTAC